MDDDMTNTPNPNMSAALDQQPANTQTESRTSDIPFTPQQKAYLMTILGIRDSQSIPGGARHRSRRDHSYNYTDPRSKHHEQIAHGPTHAIVIGIT